MDMLEASDEAHIPIGPDHDHGTLLSSEPQLCMALPTHVLVDPGVPGWEWIREACDSEREMVGCVDEGEVEDVVSRFIRYGVSAERGGWGGGEEIGRVPEFRVLETAFPSEDEEVEFPVGGQLVDEVDARAGDVFGQCDGIEPLPGGEGLQGFLIDVEAHDFFHEDTGRIAVSDARSEALALGVDVVEFPRLPAVRGSERCGECVIELNQLLCDVLPL